jgi:hypothetical protein
MLLLMQSRYLSFEVPDLIFRVMKRELLAFNSCLQRMSDRVMCCA